MNRLYYKKRSTIAVIITISVIVSFLPASIFASENTEGDQTAAAVSADEVGNTIEEADDNTENVQPETEVAGEETTVNDPIEETGQDENEESETGIDGVTDDETGEDKVITEENSEEDSVSYPESEERDNDSEEVYTEEETQESEDTAEIDLLDQDGLIENEEGMYEYIDEEGEEWVFDPRDPERYKYSHSSEKEIHMEKKDSYAPFDDRNADPYRLIYNSKLKYSYPSYYKASDGDELADIHYGIDVSKYQGRISEENWKRLKEKYGVEFAFIRAGYRGYGRNGTLNADTCYKSNITNAYNAGVAVGIYYFSQAISVEEADAEADHCIKLIEPYKDMISLPVIIDYEYSGDASTAGRLKNARISADGHTAIVNTFCDTIEEEGYSSGVYANRKMLTSDLEVSDIPDNRFIWMANYVSSDPNNIYSTEYDKRLNAWQFTSKFIGFGENDADLMNGSYTDLNFWYGDLPEAHMKEDEEDNDKNKEVDNNKRHITVSSNTSLFKSSTTDETFSGKTAEKPEGLWVSGIKDMVFTGRDIIQSDLKVHYSDKELKPEEDYSVSYSDNDEAGYASVTVTGKGAYEGEVTKSFRIKPLEIDGRLKVSDVYLDYNGKVQKAKTTVLYETDDDAVILLKEGRDYTYEYPVKDPDDTGYDSNACIGMSDKDSEYIVTIRGRGNYTGEAFFKQIILKKNSEIVPVSKLRVSYIARQSIEEGMAAEPELNVWYGLTRLERGKDYDIEYMNNAAEGIATAVIIGRGEYYGYRWETFKVRMR